VQVPLTFKPDPASTPFELKGYAFTQTHSDISNDTWIQYDPTKPQTYRIDNWNGLLPDLSITPPAAYVIPGSGKSSSTSSMSMALRTGASVTR